jgi:hypothetical protein
MSGTSIVTAFGVQLPGKIKFTHKRGERTTRVKPVGFSEDSSVGIVMQHESLE